MKNYICTFFLCCVLILSGIAGLQAQDKKIDSLKIALKNADHDTTRCVILNELIENAGDEKIWVPYNNQLRKLAETNASNTQTPSLKFFYLKYLATSLNNIGFQASHQGNVTTALEYYQLSIKIQEQINDKAGIATSLNNIGTIYVNLGDISKSLDYYLKSLKILEKIKDKSGIALALNNIGFIYKNQDDIPKALEYYLKSLKIREELNDKSGIGLSLNNIGIIYYNSGDPSCSASKEECRIISRTKALNCYQRALKIYEEINDKNGIAQSLNNIAFCYKNQHVIREALDYYNRSLKIREELNDKQAITYSLNNMATFLLEQGQVDQALVFATRSMKTATELGYPVNIKWAALTLKEIYQKQNKSKKAFEMYGLYILMRDSMNNEETRKSSVKRQFQYQYEKKAAADSTANAEEQKVKNAQLTLQKTQLKQEKTQRYALYGGLFLVAAFSIFVYNRFKVTQKQKVIIEHQKKQVDNAYVTLHEKNKEITDSIIYAKRIQSALMTSEKYIEKILNKFC